MENNKSILLITDRSTLKVIADPLRAQIFEALTTGAYTIRQISEKHNLAPSRLYYHFALLEKHGLIHVVETRKVANMTEKVYRAAADGLEIDCSLLTMASDEGKDTLLTSAMSTLDVTRRDMQRSLQARFHQLEQGARQQSRSMMISREVVIVPDEQAEEFNKKLKTLVEEFCALEVPPSTPGSMRYALMFTLYPSFYYDDQKESRTQTEN